MSGGSWDYFYQKVEEVGKNLDLFNSPLRRKLGKHLLLIAQALHDIEWVDSGDYKHGDEREAIKRIFYGDEKSAYTIKSILEQWQKDMMTKSNGVFIYGFSLYPQAKEFGLDIEIYIPGKYDPEFGADKFSFFGTLEECIQQVLDKIEEEKQELREALEE